MEISEKIMRGIEGKVAIVTGGASGIGAATVRRFLNEGASVAIGDINGEQAEILAHECGGEALPVQFDALDVDSVERLVRTTVDKFRRLDFLFNNAALTSVEARMADTNAVNIKFEWWDRIMATNARGYLAGCKYAIPEMLKTGKGSIVMTASGAGLLGDTANFAYGASKAAIMSMSRYVAVTYGKQGLRCNTVVPGLTLTDAGKRNVPANIMTIIENNTLTPRVGRPDDIAALVTFLCSEDAEFITGQEICIDGGLTMHMPYFSDFNQMKVGW
jgi:NAD(P)-dependent dehydrogenase (short-subunit alcohol dehydrogenase family)